jgi:hypothetical protein
MVHCTHALAKSPLSSHGLNLADCKLVIANWQFEIDSFATAAQRSPTHCAYMGSARWQQEQWQNWQN